MRMASREIKLAFAGKARNATTSISHELPDRTREDKAWHEWAPSRSLLASIRAYQRVRDSKLPWKRAARLLCVLRHRWWSIVTGADIPLNCHLGGGLLLPHPNGVVIHPEAIVGPNCLIFQQVTIGSLGSGAPRIGGHVDIGAGAKILGQITVGHHAKIGANAVVLSDVPDGATAVGIPAQVITAEIPFTAVRVIPTVVSN
jgi:serine O-acetyltransferase